MSKTYVEKNGIQKDPTNFKITITNFGIFEVKRGRTKIGVQFWGVEESTKMDLLWEQ